jgi:hypothetical protein
MRLDGVEVKINLDDDQTAEAVRALDLTGGTPWKNFFVEDVTPGLCTATPLLNQLSIAAKLKAAQADQAALIAFVERKGLRQTTGEAKATQVMQRLVAEAAC